MRNYVLLALFWLSCFATFAQRGWPPVYTVSPDSAFFSLDTTQFQVLEDKTGSLTFSDVQRSSSFRFAPRYDPNRQSHVYWMRMRLRNSQSQVQRLYLYDTRTDYNYLDMYWQDSSQRWRHQRTGALVPQRQKPIYNGSREGRRLLFRLAPGQESVIYQRSESPLWDDPIHYVSPTFQSVNGRLEATLNYIYTDGGWQNYWFGGIAIGILVLAIGYNLLTFFSTRERVYFYFAVCLIFFVLDRNQYEIQLALFPEYPYQFKLLRTSFFLIFFVFFIQSIRQFVQPHQALAGLKRAITVSLVVTTIVYLVQYISLQYPAIPSHEIIILEETLFRVVYGLCIVLTYRMMKRGMADARYVLIAIMPLFIWWFYTLFSNLLSTYTQIHLYKYLPVDFEIAESICFAWMIIFFSAALINRYNLTRQQVAQQALEKEQLEKEREIERNRLIASQNERLEQQVQERTAQLRESLETLKATQNQLVQKEKLASLGELTAGIAHEIQNPLNFVKNFAEVSIELLDEVREEQQKMPRDETLEGEIMADLGQNLQKIQHHGNRASAIVRGMLEHSRASTGEKQATNLNALADEYLRLAYHGLRAQNKNFNCQLITDFDPSLPQVPLVQQDVGRVLLNLFNNAFYAVQEKKDAVQDATFQPAVTVQTRGEGNQIIIRVSDNGTGIPDSVKQKIFQPFFTTKPTGQGTGLGLSLSYDIITKGHNGEMTVESREGEGTDFVIRLPA